ncbi:predicted protein [Sclerotinia sclerotiorum 1980 UF-70]|uniref:Uncharacterized protein n=1 Tax=Sclerotinia sclerotiorum (strain ATCC 18683 / 1980 / Ss-1) TaxID=665079 RepID=A7EU00_SCLS1|nr:predicted protein [Sclerotinia sclerotiorum 1980 UF-70]EDN92942.1 predicted protein [Sclerotinia sclerotiorum 1980 UF-70]
MYPVMGAFSKDNDNPWKIVIRDEIILLVRPNSLYAVVHWEPSTLKVVLSYTSVILVYRLSSNGRSSMILLHI